MKSRPILFSGEMVRAILAGNKTQTRRVVKPQPDAITMHKGEQQVFFEHSKWAYQYAEAISPYGWRGDQLWVREKMTVLHADTPHPLCTYDADRTGVIGINSPVSYCGRAVWQWKLKTLPSIFMPRWASRITLEITQVRIEQLQQIGGTDAWAEGEFTVQQFMELWDSLNTKRGFGWDSNPWVFVISFKRLVK